MTVSTVESLHAEPQTPKSWQVDWSMVTSVAGALLALLATTLAVFSHFVDEYLSRSHQFAAQYTVLAFALIVPMIFAWRRAIADHYLPSKVGAEPKYEHVSGWSALLLVTVFLTIGYLVWWAAGSDDANRTIHAEWGMWVVIGVSMLFVGVAAAPFLPRVLRRAGLERLGRSFAAALSAPVEWLGFALSSLDSFLVFSVANAAGTNRQHFILRYAILLSVIGTCAALGYYWQAPYAFIPIAWGFVVAFAVSRRWAWIEQDRELAMLNPNLSKAHIRVGFAQNLRDEALVVFLSMFLLVPLALRQAQLLADANGIELFTLKTAADIHSLPMWIAYYGTELAKAVPFVDWAEVYHVEGDAPVAAENPLALHAVFATRVLIDLVFLAALLQAISSASRDAQQRDLFYKKRALLRLDPFVEPDALRSLVRRNGSGDWEANGDAFEDFPKYDFNRLVELTAHKDSRVSRAATLLLERDGVQHDPHYRLSAESAKKGINAAEIENLVRAIEQVGNKRNVYQLDLARRRLLSKTSMTMARRHILSLITQAPHDRERTDALISALVGEFREPTYQSRAVALYALAPDTGRNLSVRAAIAQTAERDYSSYLQGEAKAILKNYPDTPD